MGLLSNNLISRARTLQSLPVGLKSGTSYSAIPSVRDVMVNPTTKFNLSDVVVDHDSDYIIRLCMIALPEVDDPDTVMRLFISAVSSASHISASQLKIRSVQKIEHVDDCLSQIAEILTDEDEDKDSRLSSISLPVPSWLSLDLTGQDFRSVLEIDPAEVSAYSGALCMAVTKSPTSENIEAFITKRANLATLGKMSGDPKVFVSNSSFLTLGVLEKINKVASFHIVPRELTMRAIATNIATMDSGNPYIFACFFLLLENSGTNALTIIRKVFKMFPGLTQDFPHWSTEVEACGQGIQKIMQLPPAERSFCKAIYGSKFVPVQYSDINHILGVCVYILSKFEPTMQNFKGGVLSDADREICDSLISDSQNDVAETQQEQE